MKEQNEKLELNEINRKKRNDSMMEKTRNIKEHDNSNDLQELKQIIRRMTLIER